MTSTKNRTLRERARGADVDLDRWFPACWSRELRRGDVRRVHLQGTAYAVFRAKDGAVHALRDRCAHRPVPLSDGEVVGDRIVCPYHGWSFDGAGRLRGIPHDRFGKAMPCLRVAALATRERYGLVWIFPGLRAGAEVALPDLGVLEGPGRWPSVGLDMRWEAHHSAVIDNVLDLSHEHLHRRFRPFAGVRLESHVRAGDVVEARYRADVASRWLRPFVFEADALGAMTMRYEYPHHAARIGEEVRNWLLLRPEGEGRTHVYVVFAVRRARLPGTSLALPRPLLGAGLRLLRSLYLEPLLREDQRVLEAERRESLDEPSRPSPELNPVVRACHALSARVPAETERAAELPR